MSAESSGGAPDPGSVRLFFALWPPPAVRAALRRNARTAVRLAGGRPVPPVNYHITLAFLGAQPQARILSIMQVARKLKPPEGRLVLARLGWFERSRVLWLAPEHSPAPLARFAHALRSALGEAGVDFDRKPFRAHLTLARKVARPPAAEVRPVAWRYSRFALVASELGGRASRYRVLAQWPETRTEEGGSAGL